MTSYSIYHNICCLYCTSPSLSRGAVAAWPRTARKARTSARCTRWRSPPGSHSIARRGWARTASRSPGWALETPKTRQEPRPSASAAQPSWTVDNSGGGGAVQPLLMNYANVRKLQNVCLLKWANALEGRCRVHKLW